MRLGHITVALSVASAVLPNHHDLEMLTEAQEDA